MEETRSAEKTLVAPDDGRDIDGPTAELHPGEILAGKYRIERILGRGAMGVVFSATHLALGGLVAVKVLSPRTAHQRGIARLHREARATASIRSEHVARVMDVGIIDKNIPFLVMEHLEGMDVAAALRNRGPFPIAEAADVVIEACDGLAAAHVLGIVHRDLKPSNLFLARQLDGSTRLKVVDFGLSKMPDAQTDGRLTNATAVMGSPHYMAPEQIANPRDVDARADIWSLGIILYELVTGRKPFDGSSPAEIFTHISALHPVPPSHWRRDLPSTIESLILGCLEKNPEARPAHVGIIAEKLAPFCGASAQLLSVRIGRVIGNIGTKEESSVELPEMVRPGATADESREGSLEHSTAWSGEMAASREGSVAGGDIVRAGIMLGGRFQVEKFLGRGAMGAVYEVTDEHGARFAVKLLPVEASAHPEARKRLRREARLASTLSHDHVVNVIDVCIDERGDAPFILMELLRGENLAEALQSAGVLSSTTVARIFRQVCQGLMAAHAQGLVHRDVKPANIFLHDSGDGTITVKICDFGIAKRTESSTLDASAQALTKTGFMLGTPAYVSPEQIKDATAVDARSDIWSVCVSMYEALSGKHPWPHCRTPGELIVAICTEKPVPSGKAAPWVDPSLGGIIMRGIELDPQKRWQTAKDLDAALAEFIGSSNVITIDDLVGIAAEERVLRGHSRATRSGGKSEVRRRVLGALALLAGALLLAMLMYRFREKPLTARSNFSDFAPAVEPSTTNVPVPFPSVPVFPISSASVGSNASVSIPPAPRTTASVRESSREKSPDTTKTVATPEKVSSERPPTVVPKPSSAPEMHLQDDF